MPKLKAGMFSWALLSVTVVCVAAPAFAQSTATEVAPKEVTPSAIPSTTPAEVVPTPKEDTAKPGTLAVSDRNVQILKSFNDRYQCGIANIDQAITRADFANNIAVCLTSIEVKLAQNPTAVATDDLTQLREMTSQFMDEVSYLGNRLESVEKKVGVLQKSTFSNTTKLNGEVIVGLTTNSSQTRTGDTNQGNTQFANRVRLNFDTSFTGKDRLRTRLQARNLTSLNGGSGTPNSLNGGTGTNATRLGFDGDENNGVNVSLLQYTLPVFDNSKLIIETVGSEFNENMYTFNPQLASSGSGSLTRFGRYNPVYRQSGDGAAATFDYRMSPEFSVALGYAIPGAFAASVANSPNNDAGVFGGNYAGIVQFRYQPSPDLDLGLSYARSYHSTGSGVTGSTGTNFSNNPFNGAPTVANHYSFSASTKLSPGFILSGWVGLTNANIEAGGTRTGSADILNGAITAAFTDVGGKGNTLGFIIGVPPTVSSISSSVATNRIRYNPETSLHLEALYKIKVSDNLDITPGVLLITSPESQPGAGGSRGSEFVGTVRTTFKF
jgi:Carbohydrate-selective porin, OprB family